MALNRQQQIGIAIVVLLLAGAGYWFWPRQAATTGGASKPKAAGSKGATAEAQLTAPDVHLEALQAAHPAPADLKRNLFRFKPKPVPPPPVVVVAPIVRPPPPPPPPAQTGPPPPPPIPLKFAGQIMQGSVKVASLIDSMGRNIYGKEGDIIEGRYKIWRIGPNSIDISYLDGRGRVSIPMNGSGAN